MRCNLRLAVFILLLAAPAYAGNPDGERGMIGVEPFAIHESAPDSAAFGQLAKESGWRFGVRLTAPLSEGVTARFSYGAGNFGSRALEFSIRIWFQ